MIIRSARPGWSRTGTTICWILSATGSNIPCCVTRRSNSLNRFQPHEILIEDASTGIALAQDLREKGYFFVNPIKIEHDKIGSLYVQQAKFAAGRVWFPKNAPYMPELERELLTFPQSRHNDQVDSISQALAYDGDSYDWTLSWVG